MISKILQHSVNALPWNIRRNIKYIPMVAAIQRMVFNYFLSGREFIHLINAGPAKGLFYPVKLPEDKAIWSGTYEYKFAERLSCAVNDGDICYDIGGYRGFFTGVFALSGAKEVIVFEPYPDNIAQLKYLKKINPKLPISIQPIAVGDIDSIVKFNIMPDASMGKVVGSQFQEEADKIKDIDVTLRKIDTLVFSDIIPPPDIIKIDVEGYEVKALNGSISTLDKYRPRLLIEAHSNDLKLECIKILGGIGYSVVELEPYHPESKRNEAVISHIFCEFIE